MNRTKQQLQAKLDKRAKYIITDWGKSLTRQEFANDTDINTIVKRAKLGQFVVQNRSQALYDDISQYGDYQTMYERKLEIDKEFVKIPSEIRKKFANNPNALAIWVKDPKNEQEAIKLGLRLPKTPDTRPEPPPTPAQPSAGN